MRPACSLHDTRLPTNHKEIICCSNTPRYVGSATRLRLNSLQAPASRQSSSMDFRFLCSRAERQAAGNYITKLGITYFARFVISLRLSPTAAAEKAFSSGMLFGLPWIAPSLIQLA